MVKAVEVVLIFTALASWAALLVYGISKQKYGPFLAFGVLFATLLDVRHLLVGSHDAFSLVVGVYDVLSNVGLSSTPPSDMVPCQTKNCTMWGENLFGLHPSWSVRFYERFVNGPDTRKRLLLIHNVCNTFAFLVLHLQFLRPGHASVWHKLLGGLSFSSMTVSLISALQMANEHVHVNEYGNAWSRWGFYEMALSCFVPAALGIVKIRAGDKTGHRRWMWRYAGAMWGSFFIFRVGLLLIDPLFRGRETIAWLLVTWGSAPVGIAVAEVARCKLDAKQGSKQKIK